MALHFCFLRGSPPWQVGGSLRAAEIHWVHVKDGGENEIKKQEETADELLVVGVLFDVSKNGTNVEVRLHGRETWLVSPSFLAC